MNLRIYWDTQVEIVIMSVEYSAMIVVVTIVVKTKVQMLFYELNGAYSYRVQANVSISSCYIK